MTTLLITLALLTLIASIDWPSIPDALSDWLDAMDLVEEVRDV